MESNNRPIEVLEGPVIERGPLPGIGKKDEDIEDVPLFKREEAIIPALLVMVAAAAGGYYNYMNMHNFVSTDDACVDSNNAAVSTKTLGRIIYRGTDEGDTVKTGKVLVGLDDRDLSAEEVSAQSTLGLAKQSVPLAQVNLRRTQDDFNRAQVQYTAQIITKEAYQHAQQTLHAAKAQLSISESNIQTAQAQ